MVQRVFCGRPLLWVSHSTTVIPHRTEIMGRLTLDTSGFLSRADAVTRPAKTRQRKSSCRQTTIFVSRLQTINDCPLLARVYKHAFVSEETETKNAVNPFKKYIYIFYYAEAFLATAIMENLH